MSKFVYIIIAILLFAILLIYMKTHQTSITSHVSQFENDSPKSYYISLVSEFGPPQTIINQPNGFSMWFPSKMENSPYETVILKDEKNDKFVYTTIIVNIPNQQLQNILQIYKDIKYDTESKELTVKGSNIIQNKYVISAILNYLNGNITTVDQAKNTLKLKPIDNMLSSTQFSSTIFSDDMDDDINNVLLKLEEKYPTKYRLNKELILVD